MSTTMHDYIHALGGTYAIIADKPHPHSEIVYTLVDWGGGTKADMVVIHKSTDVQEVEALYALLVERKN